MKVTLYRKNRTKKEEFWTIEVDGSTITYTWGEVGTDRPQSTSNQEPPVNVGKANMRSGEEQAKRKASKEIEDRIKEGYRYQVGDKASEVIDPKLGPPPWFRGPKPVNTPKEKDLLWDDHTSLLRKHNGICFPVFVNEDSKAIVFSRKFSPVSPVDNESWTKRFPRIVEDFEKYARPIQRFSGGVERVGRPIIPPVSLFMCEFCGPERDDDGDLIDDPVYVGRVAKSSLEGSLELQKQHGHLVAVILDVWILGGKFLLGNVPWDSRWNQVLSVYHRLPFGHTEVVCDITRTETPSIRNLWKPEKAMEYVERRGWEGLVIVRGDKFWPQDSLNFTGKVYRPAGYVKFKPEREDDFVAVWSPGSEGGGSYGTGKNSNRIGSVGLFQFDADGNLVFVSECGVGMSDEQRKAWADPCLWPMVWTVKFADWTEKGSLVHPKFVCVREDKSPGECLLSSAVDE